MNNWITMPESVMLLIKKHREKNKISAVYRWIVQDDKGNIIAGYVGQTSNLGLRYYDYTRPYEEKHKEQYPTDYKVATNIVNAKSNGNKVLFQIVENLTEEQLSTVEQRKMIEREGIIDIIKRGADIWNSVN